MEAITEAATVGRETGLPVQISHFKIDTKSLWGMSEKTLALVDQFRREGVVVVIAQYPYERSSTTLCTTLPSWALADGSMGRSDLHARIAPYPSPTNQSLQSLT